MISTIKPFNTYCTRISFKKNQENYIERQVKQILYENFDDINKQTVKKSQREIEDIYLPKFKEELQKEKGNISKQDLKNFMSTLSSIYKKSGLDKDAEILREYSEN